MWWKSEKREVTAFLYRILVAEAPAKGYARTVAERMQVPYPTLSKYWLGRRFPASLVRPLFLATGCSERVADFFLLEGSGLRLARRQAAAGRPDVGRAVATLTALAGRAAEIHLRATTPRVRTGSP